MKPQTSVVNALKGVYCDLGLPKKVLTDNGPCFKSQKFEDFYAQSWILVLKNPVLTITSQWVVWREWCRPLSKSC